MEEKKTIPIMEIDLNRYFHVSELRDLFPEDMDHVANFEASSVVAQDLSSKLREVIINSKMTIFGNTIKGITLYATVEYPATWWQHFKLRWFSKWLLKKFPVKTTKKSKYCAVDIVALYPHIIDGKGPSSIKAIIRKTNANPQDDIKVRTGEIKDGEVTEDTHEGDGRSHQCLKPDE